MGRTEVVDVVRSCWRRRGRDEAAASATGPARDAHRTGAASSAPPTSASGSRCAAGWAPPRARRAPRVRRPARPQGHRAVRRRRRRRRCRASTCASRAWCAAARGHGQPRAWPPARSRSASARSRSSTRPSRRRSRSTSGDEADEIVRLRHRYVDLRRADAAQPAGAGHGQQRDPPAPMERQGFVEIETPMLIAPTPEGARDFVVPSACSRVASTRCRRARSCSSSCAWSAASIATTRSPAACATRTCGPTASSSSCSSTPRQLRDQEEVLEFIGEAVLDASEAVTGTIRRHRSR